MRYWTLTDQTTNTAVSSARSEPAKYALRVNAFDRTSSVLIALLMMVGMVVLGLVIIYFTSRVYKRNVAIPVTPISPPSGPKKPAGMDPNKTPGSENAPEELEPKLESKLNMMAGLVAAQSALLDSEEFDPLASAPKGEGGGDPRQADGDGSGNGPPEPQRELRFEPESLDDYARWLDSIGTEIAVLGYDNKIYYAANLAAASPKVRTGEPKEETRLYFNTAGTPLAPLDRQLAQKANIFNRGALILQFCANETHGLILGLEQQEAENNRRQPIDIKRTIFRVQKQRGKYEFSVEKQEYKL